MAKFDGSAFCLICGHLRTLEKSWEQNRDAEVSAEDLASIVSDIKFVSEHCQRAGLSNSVGYIEDNLSLLDASAVASINRKLTYEFVSKIFGTLGSQIRAEMKRVEFLYVDNPKFYSDHPLFDSFVTDIYAGLSYDVVEAGNCLALSRPTASVFHLMRVMEFGVQRFGQKLGVPLVNEIVWQVILDQVSSKIRTMPEKPAARKRIKESYADLAAHLYNVKVAWRNTVMHPKRTYTVEEAERLFDTVKTFMGVLVKLLRPKRVARLKEQPSLFPNNSVAMKAVFEVLSVKTKTE
jgi:hypothetical protein